MDVASIVKYHHMGICMRHFDTSKKNEKKTTSHAGTQVMDFRRLCVAKPLPGPMLAYCQLDPYKRTSVKFESQLKMFNSRKCIWKCCLWKSGHFVQGEMINDVLFELSFNEAEVKSESTTNSMGA